MLGIAALIATTLATFTAQTANGLANAIAAYRFAPPLGERGSERLRRPALDFALHGLPDEVGTLLIVHQHGVDPRKGAVTEACGSLLPIDSRPAHGCRDKIGR